MQLHAKQEAAFKEAQAIVAEARRLETTAHEKFLAALKTNSSSLDHIGQRDAWAKAAAHATSPAAVELASAATMLDDKAANATKSMFERAMHGGPHEVRGMWASLTSAQQADLTGRFPQMVGSTDGVPAVARDQANRSRLEGQRQAVVNKLREERERLDPDHENAHDWARIDELEEALAGIDKLKATLEAPGSNHYLLGIDSIAHGRGRVIIASGNPDTADHVMTSVPGTTADLGGATGDVQRNDAMLQRARELAPGQEVAGVTWVDYQSPADVFPYAMSGSYSDDARADLSQFQEGLRATHEGPPSHNTILGHSYGSTVVGETARDYDVHADDVAFLGSPGVGVDQADQLGVPPEHVWSGTSESDMIEYGVTAKPWEWFWEGDYHIHGHDPSDPSFGARTLPTDPTGSHTEYWNKKTSLDGMARLTVGQTEGMR